MKRKLPVAKTDRHAASVVKNADLSKYDLGSMRTERFELEPKKARLKSKAQKPDQPS